MKRACLILHLFELILNLCYFTQLDFESELEPNHCCFHANCFNPIGSNWRRLGGFTFLFTWSFLGPLKLQETLIACLADLDASTLAFNCSWKRWMLTGSRFTFNVRMELMLDYLSLRHYCFAEIYLKVPSFWLTLFSKDYFELFDRMTSSFCGDLDPCDHFQYYS